MKSILVLTTLLVLASITVQGQDTLDLAGPPTGYWDNNGVPTVDVNVPIIFTIHMVVTEGYIVGMDNGFRVYISDQSDGSTVLPSVPFEPMWGDTIFDMINDGGLDLGFWVMVFNADGIGIDTLGFGGAVSSPGGMSNLGPDFAEDVYVIGTSISAGDGGEGHYLCLDSSSYPPVNDWIWAIPGCPGPCRPYWGGPYCYAIESCCLDRGNVDGVSSGLAVDVSDLTYLVAYLFLSGPTPPCVSQANVDSVSGTGGPIDVADLTYLVAYLFTGGSEPPDCS